MQKIIYTLLLCCLYKVAAFSIPAYPRPHVVKQADGSTITIVGRGNEFCHYATTTDGYTVVKGNDGLYHYANLEKGCLVPTSVVAQDKENRLDAEVRFLENRPKNLAPSPAPTAQRMMKQRMCKSVQTLGRRLPKNSSAEKKPFRGLVLLVNFNDCKFSRGDEESKNIYNAMMNQQNFTGYNDRFHGQQTFTGSVRDYFSDNSYGTFAPEFDVIGPIDIDCSQYAINGVDNTYEIVEKVLRTANDSIDYSRYDSDGDGEVDMFYIIYAGYSSSYEGNDERLLWPHAASMADEDGPEGEENLYLDGVRMGRFACSSEIYGWESDNKKMLDGIGVIVHEFSHILGFEDHYDSSGGYQEHPNTWDLMSAGSYNGEYNRTPCGYNSYEKYVAGFIKPRVISDMENGHIQLRSLELSDDACMIRSCQDSVFFLIENRQFDKWDKGLEGHGMLVWRVDSTVPMLWKYNAVNVTPRACFKLIRAGGTQGNILLGIVDTPNDPFPGNKGVWNLTNETLDANLLSYDRIASPVVLKNISEIDGKIDLDVERDEKSDKLPIDYTLHSRYTVEADMFEDGEWKPTSWTMRTVRRTNSNGTTSNIIYNLIPGNDNVPLSCQISSNETKLTVGAQRMSLTTDSSIWLCNMSDIEASGAGALTMEVSRRGIPQMDSDSTVVGLCSMPASAYLVSKKKMISRLSSYRNIHFRDYDEDSSSLGIDAVENRIPYDNAIYNLQGQRVSVVSKGIYIRGGKKVIVK